MNHLLMEKGLLGNADIFDISTRTAYIFDPFILMKFQKNIDELYPDSEVEIIPIDTAELPDDIFQCYLKLKEYVYSD